MTQLLYLKGDKGLREMKVIRSWQDSQGAQIYLHASGVYGYKDGSPVMDEKEFDIIGDATQKKLALKWWKNKGRKLSREFYEAREQEMEQRQEAEIPTIEGDVSDLDAALYRRRKGKTGKWSDAATWYEFFKARPDWWGYAENITIAGHTYELLDLESEEGPESEEGDEAAANF